MTPQIPTPQGNQMQGQQTQQQSQERVMKFIFGGLTREPELKITQNGSPVTNLDIAMSTPKGTIYYQVNVWGTAAYYVQNLKKGNKISAFGQYEQSQYTKQDGTTGYTNTLKNASVYLDFGYILESVYSMVQGMQQQAPQQAQTQQPQAQPQPQVAIPSPKADDKFVEVQDMSDDFPFV